MGMSDGFKLESLQFKTNQNSLFYDGLMCKFESLLNLMFTIVDKEQTNDNSTQVEFEREIG